MKQRSQVVWPERLQERDNAKEEDGNLRVCSTRGSKEAHPENSKLVKIIYS